MTAQPKKRGRPRKDRANSQFPGTVIQFNSRPRLMVGDVVELCRGCLPSNHGKLAIIREIRDGAVLVEAINYLLDTYDPETGENMGVSRVSSVDADNLYRRSKSLAR